MQYGERSGASPWSRTREPLGWAAGKLLTGLDGCSVWVSRGGGVLRPASPSSLYTLACDSLSHP